MAEEQAHLDAGHHDGGVDEIEGVPPQITTTPGMPERKAVGRRQARVRENLHLLPKNAQEAILESLEADGQKYPGNGDSAPGTATTTPTPHPSPPNGTTETTWRVTA